MSSANGKKLLALAVAGVLGSSATASAAPYLTVSLLGSTTGPAGPYSSSVVATTPGQVIDYKIQVQAAPEGTTNPFHSQTASRTITNWIPNTTGLNSIGFSLSQEATPGTIQSDFDAAPAPGTTGGGSWSAGFAYTAGNVEARGNGNDDLTGVILSRASGNYDGVAGADGAEVMELLDVASGQFDIAAGGDPSVVNVNFDSFAAGTLIMAMRWRNAANTANVGPSWSVTDYNNSVAGGDPLIVFNGLALVPEPASLGLLGLAAVGALGRRRRA